MSPMAASTTLLFALFISIISLSSSFPPMKMATNNVHGFKTYLIHCDSPQSPLYDPNSTVSDRIKAAKMHSSARRRYFSSPDEVTAPLSLQGGEYLIKYLIGTPPVVTYGIADTGSDLIWLQCLPCMKCYPQKTPIFDTSKSSSYSLINCGTTACDAVENSGCQGGKCGYHLVYQDGASTQGYLAYETLTFGDAQSGNISLNNMIFGCGYSNSDTGTADENAPGVVGLNLGPASLVVQISFGHFSYCFVPKNMEKSNSPLHFGLSAMVDGARTPLKEVNGRYNYYLNLEGISVDNETIPIPPGTFTVTAEGKGGFIMDSGTTFTEIDSVVYKRLVIEVEKKTLFDPVTDTTETFDLCYEENLGELEVGGAEITFHFTGADLVLKGMNVWVSNGHGLTCLAMGGVHDGFSVLGNHQLQNVYVEYNLKEKYISFKPTDCTKV